MSHSPAAFAADNLAATIDRVGAALCVGIDPVLERLPDVAPGEPAARFERFQTGVIDAVRGVAAAVKFQSACYERHGTAGWAALRDGIAYARESGLFVVLDAKRGDIGVSSEHYAAAASDDLQPQAVTVSPYLGMSVARPFLDAGLAVFCLVRTSNPDSDELQARRLESGETVAELVAGQVAEMGKAHIGERGLSALGAVVGATKAGGDEFTRLRARMPDQIFLVPGIGAQGGTIDALRPMLREGATTPAEGGVLVTASRSVIYAEARGNEGWTSAVARAAREHAEAARCLS